MWLGSEECKVTWEKASDLPPEVITEFECGSTAFVMDKAEPRMGESVHTLIVSSTQSQSSRRPVIKTNTGYTIIICYTTIDY